MTGDDLKNVNFEWWAIIALSPTNKSF